MDESQKHDIEQKRPDTIETYHMVPFTWNSITEKTKFVVTESRPMVTWNRRRQTDSNGEWQGWSTTPVCWGSPSKPLSPGHTGMFGHPRLHTETFLGWWKFSQSWPGQWLYGFVKTHSTVHLKWLHFTLCKLHLYKVNLKSKTIDHYVIRDVFTTLNIARCLSFLCCYFKASIKSIRVCQTIKSELFYIQYI